MVPCAENEIVILKQCRGAKNGLVIILVAFIGIVEFLIYHSTSGGNNKSSSWIDISGTFLTITVPASDASGIDRIEIYVDGTLMTTLTNAGPTYSYTLNIKALKTADHIIKATAYDNNGTALVTATLSRR